MRRPGMRWSVSILKGNRYVTYNSGHPDRIIDYIEMAGIDSFISPDSDSCGTAAGPAGTGALLWKM